MNLIAEKMYRKVFWIIFFTGFIKLSSYSQQVDVKATLEKDTILIGDQVSLLLEVEHKRGIFVNFPIHEEKLSEHIEIISFSSIDTSITEEDVIIERQEYLITSFDSGVFNVPPFIFAIEEKERMDTITTASIPLVVNTFPVDLTQPIKDIKEIYRYPISFKDILPFLLIALGLGIITYIGIYVIKRIKRKEPILKIFEKPKIPPEVIALRDLDRLKVEKIWQKGRVKEYYSRLTEIVRTYIEGRFDIMAMEQTSDEILKDFRNAGYDNTSEYNVLKEMFSLADTVKFAKGDALPDENNKHMANAYHFVEITTPKEVEKENEQEMSETINEEGN